MVRISELILLMTVISVSLCTEIPAPIEEQLTDALCKAQHAVKHNVCSNIQPDCLREEQIDWVVDQNGTGIQIRLLCKGDNMLSWTWNKTCNHCSYIVLYRHKNSSWNFAETTTCNKVNLPSLTPFESYQVQLWQVNANGTLMGPAESIWESTAGKESVPLQVKKFIVSNYTLRHDTQKYEAILRWEPDEDVPCYYDLVIFNGGSDYKQVEYKNPINPFETTIRNLDFNTNYSIAIMSKSTDWRRESKKQWLYFMTPSCIDEYNDLTICPPLPPDDVELNETISESADHMKVLHNIKVYWRTPDLYPDYYKLELSVFSVNHSKYELNVSGEATSATFLNVYVGLQYRVSIAAYSSAGHSKYVYRYRNTQSTFIPQTTWSTSNLLITIFGCFILLCIIIASSVFICHYHAKKERNEKRCQYFQELEEKTPQRLDTFTETLQIDPNDKWEIIADRISLGSILGQGAFGVVRKGWLKMDEGNYKEVAVKMLQEYPSTEEKRQLLQEIEIMKSVGPHKHLVSILGCCIRSNNPLLIVEYCSRGDLKTYLQNAWETITNDTCDIHYAELIGGEQDITELSQKHFANKTYYMQNENMIQPRDLLSFARQIAIGMEYLSSLHVLHRDLAARNVLVCEDKTVKVSDFGLSRDVYRDNVYYKIGNGKLPIRWMALESITHQVYTTQSDIWSFGILLWEIVTLGGNPYPGISTNDLPKRLQSGYRMERPNNCSVELYNLMVKCWKKSPKERPSFTDIKNYLDKLLENVSDYLQLGVTTCKEMNTTRCNKSEKNRRTASSERYVKPITSFRTGM